MLKASSSIQGCPPACWRMDLPEAPPSDTMGNHTVINEFLGTFRYKFVISEVRCTDTA